MKDQPAIAKSRRASSSPLHRVIYKLLLSEIEAGTYPVGDRLPSEAALCTRFKASRITVAKAIQQLQRDGLVSRRAGSGTYIQGPVAADSLKFGLLIPELGSTEIFETICRGMMGGRHGKSHTLMWGNTAPPGTTSEAAALDLCQQLLSQRVDGIFFAPIEHSSDRDAVNERILGAIEKSRTPTILLDRTVQRFPLRSRFDLVGIDNHRAGFVLTEHLLSLGRRRVVFAAAQYAPSTVEARIGGYRLALLAGGSRWPGAVIEGDFTDPKVAQTLLREHQPDAIVCANDLTAARLMRTLLSLGIRIPGDVAVVGVDNVHYASLLPVPLTTIAQNCLEIGAAAMSLMFDRLGNRDRPGRDLLVDFTLVVRESCGARDRGRTVETAKAAELAL